jgi:hypothetical protein
MRATCLVAVLLAGLPLAAADRWDRKVEKTAGAVRAAGARAPFVELDTEIKAAELLRETHPQLAWQFATEAASRMKAADSGNLVRRLVLLLMAIKPVEGEAAVRALPQQSDAYNALVYYWMQKDDPAKAAEAVKESWAKGLYIGNTSRALSSLVQKQPEAAARLIRELLDLLPPEKAALQTVLALQLPTESIAAKDPATARTVFVKLFGAVAREDFNAGSSPELFSTYKFGDKQVETLGARDTLLLRLGLYLRSLDPDLYSKNEKLFERWRDDIAAVKPGEEEKVAKTGNMIFMSREALEKRRAAGPAEAGPKKPAPPPKPAPFAEAYAKAMSAQDAERASLLTALVKRADVTDAERMQAARELVRITPALPVSKRFEAAGAAFWAASELDLKPLLKPAAGVLLATLADLEQCKEAYCETQRRSGSILDGYDTIAAAARRSKLHLDNPAVTARGSLLDLSDVLDENYDFKLAGIQGGEYALRAQRGRVVMLNFWATW